MDLTKKRWFILIIYCLINLCIGSIYAWSVFSVPMEEFLNETYHRNLSDGSLSIVFMVTSTLAPLVMIIGGRLNDKFGPRWLIFFGDLLFGGGTFASGFAADTPFLIASYGIGCGAGMGLVYSCTIGNSIKFFPDKRGLAGGIATASYGISSILVPPIASGLINAIDVVHAFHILGIAFLLIICAGAFLVDQCPQGFEPAGWEGPQSGSASNQTPSEFTWQEMIRTPIFYVMMLILMCGTLSGMMCISQTSGVAQQMIGLSVSTAALCVSLLSLFNTGGRVAAGFLSDRIGRVHTLTIGFILSLGGLLLLFVSNANMTITFYGAIALIGLSYGSIMGTFPAFTADRFGSKNNSVNYGIMCIGYSIAGFVGPMIMRTMYARQGVYNNAFLVAALFTLTGLLLIWIYKRKRT